jgi:hypothetical protein
MIGTVGRMATAVCVAGLAVAVGLMPAREAMTPSREAAVPASNQAGLTAPVRLMADGKPISVEVGHAAPAWADIDGDGKRELLVGQFGGGKLRIYKNLGTPTEPRFGSFTWLTADGQTVSVPAG